MKTEPKLFLMKPAFSKNELFRIFALCSSDALREANLKYPYLRSRDYYEPWQITQILE